MTNIKLRIIFAMDAPNLSPADKAAIERKLNLMEIEDASMYDLTILLYRLELLMKLFKLVLKLVSNRIVQKIWMLLKPIVLLVVPRSLLILLTVLQLVSKNSRTSPYLTRKIDPFIYFVYFNKQFYSNTRFKRLIRFSSLIYSGNSFNVTQLYSFPAEGVKATSPIKRAAR